MNLRVHGIDFAALRDELDFADADMVASYGGRFRATSALRGRLVTIVFALLGTEGLSIVSARPASRKERKAYESR